MTDTAWLLLDEHGIICECNGSYDAVFGRHKSDIVAMHVATLLPELADIPLLQENEPNPRLRFLSRIGVRFHVLNQAGELLPCDIFLGRLRNSGIPPLRLVIRRVNDLLAVPPPPISFGGFQSAEMLISGGVFVPDINRPRYVRRRTEGRAAEVSNTCE